MLKKIIRATVIVIVLVVSILIINSTRFHTQQISLSAASVVAMVSDDSSAQILSQAVQIPTIANNANSKDSFNRWLAFIKESFADIYSILHVETINERSLLLTWQGQDPSLSPVLLTAHFDVVPIEEESEKSWKYPPFSGQIAENYIWGRGALDDKSAVVSILLAISALGKEGFRPQRTFYFAFGADEEIGGHGGAAKIVEVLQERQVKPEFIVDEGLFITEGILKGVTSPVALVGIAEKGYLNLELSVERPGGHSSRPPYETAIGILSRAVARLAEHPMNAQLTLPVEEMFKFLGPEMPVIPRLALANRWLFDPLLKLQLASSETTNALIRTTGAPTILKSGIAENVLPAKATAIFNFRLLPGDSADSVITHAKKVIDDERIKINVLGEVAEASAVTPVTQASFMILHRTIKEVFPNVLVAPSLLIATTDSQHYSKLSKNIYRFRPFWLNQEDLARFHGVNERISVENFQQSIKFFYQLIRNTNIELQQNYQK